MNDSALKAEVQSDPAGLGYAARIALGDHVGLAALLNDPTKGTPAPRPVPLAEFALFAAGMGLRGKLEAGGLAGDPPAGLCKTVIELLTTSPHAEAFDPSNGLPLLGTLRDAGILAASDVATVTAFVTRPTSRAEVLLGLGVIVTHQDITRALRS